MKSLGILLISALLSLPSVGSAGTFTWDPVTRCLDGSAVTEAPTYWLYLTPVGEAIAQKIATTKETSVTLLTLAGAYYVTGFTSQCAESPKSNIVVLKQSAPPANLRWTP